MLRHRPLRLAVLLWAAGLVTALAVRPLMPVDETRYLTVAWEMWSRGDWLVPHLNGAPYPHKPPLLFWAIGGAWTLFGVGEATARAVPPLFALAAIGLVARLGALLWPDRERLPGQAALWLAGTLVFALFATTATFDATLATTTLVGLVGVARAWRRHDWRGWLLFGLGLGGGLLVKGPVALLHLLPVPLLAPLWQRDLRPARWGRWYAGLAAGTLLGAGLALAWAVPAAVAGGDAYGRAILWGQTAGRVVHSFAHARPWWFYLSVVPILLLPWVLWPTFWRALRREVGTEPDDGLRFGVVWVVVVLAGLSAVSGKGFHYLVPLLPAAALLGARVVAAEGRAETTLVRLAAASGLVFVVVHLAAWPILAERHDLSRLSAHLARHERGGLAVLGAYQGEFGFLGRLTAPVAELGADDVAAWAAAHPGGRLVVRFRETSPVEGVIEVEQRYRGSRIAVLDAGAPMVTRRGDVAVRR